MSWIFWPELIVFAVCVILLMFGIYYVVRKWKNLFRRVEQLEQTVYQDKIR